MGWFAWSAEDTPWVMQTEFAESVMVFERVSSPSSVAAVNEGDMI